MKRLILGTAQFGLDYGISNVGGQVSKDSIVDILKESQKNDLSLLDTSSAYGTSQKTIGDLRQAKQFKIITKLVGNGDVNQEIKTTYTDLDRDTVYGYLIHDFENFRNNPTIWEKLVELKKKDLVEKIGFSLYYPEELEYILEKKTAFDLLQVPFNIFDQRFAKYFSILKDMGVEIHTRSVFLQGLFFMNDTKLDTYFSNIREKLSTIKSLGSKNKLSIVDLCLGFNLSFPKIDKVIVGVTTSEEIEEILATSHMNLNKGIKESLLNLREDRLEYIIPSLWPKK